MINQVNMPLYSQMIKTLIARDWSQEKCLPYINKTLKEWSEKKENLFTLFGGELKKVYEISNSLDNEVVYATMMEDFDKDLKYPLLKHVLPIIFEGNSVADVSRSFTEGILLESTTIGGVLYKAGIKLTKVLTPYVKKEQLADFEREYSQAIQSVKRKGFLVLSIDPCDFLSMSESNSWDSCQSLDGEVKTGGLSLMQDSHTIIAYTCSNLTEGINFGEDLTHNSKQWRQLVFVNPLAKAFIQNRHYAFHISLNSEEVKEKLIEMLEIEKPIHSKDLNAIHSFFVTDLEDYGHYCDISNCKDSFKEDLELTCLNLEWDYKRSPMTIGSRVGCPVEGCGDYSDSTEELLCWRH